MTSRDIGLRHAVPGVPTQSRIPPAPPVPASSTTSAPAMAFTQPPTQNSSQPTLQPPLRLPVLRNLLLCSLRTLEMFQNNWLLQEVHAAGQLWGHLVDKSLWTTRERLRQAHLQKKATDRRTSDNLPGDYKIVDALSRSGDGRRRTINQADLSKECVKVMATSAMVCKKRIAILHRNLGKWVIML